MSSTQQCDYCGLPVPPSFWGKQRPVPADEPAYCCFGCRFAAEVTKSRGEEGAATWALTRLGLAVFFAMNVMVFSMALWSQELYTPESNEAALADSVWSLFRYLCLLLALPVLLLLGIPLADNAIDDLRQGRLTTDLLILVGVIASFLYSTVAVLREQGSIYFDVGCMVLVFVTLGRWLEARGKLKTSQTLDKLQRLLPEYVRIAGSSNEVPLESVQVGQEIRVFPGERIPCDGVIVNQPTYVDDQILTGESTPTAKSVGSQVYAGSLNLDADLIISVTAPGDGGALARLLKLMRDARAKQTPFERLADRVAAVFLPIITLIALLALVVHSLQSGIEQGILASLAVLLIACPCALGLATPMAIWTALGRAAEEQVLFRDGEQLERLARVRAVCFDKTGTLTTGMSSVCELIVADGCGREQVIQRARALAATSLHAHALAITRFSECNSNTTEVDEARSLPGRGVMAHERGTGAAIFLGSLRFLEEQGLCVPGELRRAAAEVSRTGKSVVWLGWQTKVCGLFVLQEELRPEAKDALRDLRGQRLAVRVLTGDTSARAETLRRELRINVDAELLPEDKVDAIEQMRRQFGTVAMVGDGINDGPALSVSDVGIAMGCGADIARESAGICLLSDNLHRLPWTIELSRVTVRVMRQNLFWAFFYNMIGVGLACTGLLSPILAALAMVLSSLLVVSNSLRLRRKSIDTDAAVKPVEIP